MHRDSNRYSTDYEVGQDNIRMMGFDLQNVLNNLYEQLGSQTVSEASAFSQARRHLKHMPFIKLNRSIIESCYQKYLKFVYHE